MAEIGDPYGRVSREIFNRFRKRSPGRIWCLAGNVYFHGHEEKLLTAQSSSSHQLLSTHDLHLGHPCNMKSGLDKKRVLTIAAFLITCRGAGGGLMHHMMKKMMDKHHHHHDEKTIGISFKPVAIPIPVPIAYMEKGSMKAEKPWPQESKGKGMMMKMMKMKMKMKMKMMKKMMKKMKGSKKGGCCPPSQQQMMMKAGWPMIMPMICPQAMMMNGGCNMAMNGCMMNQMNGGWPMNGNGGGWPMKGNGGGCPELEEEEMEREEEDWPEYYDEEMMEDQYAWDTQQVPVYVSPKDQKETGTQRRGDDLADPEKLNEDTVVWVRVKATGNKRFQGPRNKFDYDFDFDYF